MQLTGRVSKSSVLLVVLGAVALILYRVGLGADGAGDIRWFIKLVLVQAIIYLLAVWIVVRARASRSTLLIVITFAVLFRLSILFALPYLSDDIYRYVWDGRVQASGINPYRYVPAAPELAHLRDDTIYPRINRREYAHTIYPPLAQIVFLVTTRISESVVWMKLTILAFEALAIWAIAQLLTLSGLARQRLLIYAWHPLAVWEFAGSGHVDALTIAFIFLALLAWQRRTDFKAGVALASAALVKLFPLVLLPAFYKRGRWRTVLVLLITLAVAYLPYLSVGPKVFGFLPGYAMEQGLVSGEQFYLLSLARRLLGTTLPSFVFIGFAAIVMGGIAYWVIRQKSNDHMRPALVLATTATVLFAPHYTWYFVWLVPFLCFSSSLAVFYLTLASFVLYFTWLGDSNQEMFFINSVLYLPFFLIAAIEFLVKRFGWEKLLSHAKAQRREEASLETR